MLYESIRNTTYKTCVILIRINLVLEIACNSESIGLTVIIRVYARLVKLKSVREKQREYI